MSSRAAVLAGLALAVLAAGVWLFVQVRETPAQAQVSPRAHAPEVAHDEPPVEPSDTPSPETHPQVGKPLEHPAQISDVRPSQGPALGDDHPAISEVPDKADPRFMMVLGEANKAYDRQDFDEARTIAQKVLAKDPGNTRMLRIMVSSHCIEGDQNAAQQWYEKLPEFDRQQMTKRCSQYGVAFKEPGQ